MAWYPGPDALVPIKDPQDLKRDKSSDAARCLDKFLTGSERKYS